jgi:hypothetical protein
MKSQINQLSGALGAYLACSEEETARIQAWLSATGRMAHAFVSTVDFIAAVEVGRFGWVAVASAGRALVLPDFDRFFRAVIETDTELWSAEDDSEVGLHLFCSMVENWEFLAPYVPESSETISLTHVRDALSRIESRLRLRDAGDNSDPAHISPAAPSVDSDVVRLVAEMHEVVVQRQANRLESLSQTERDLYDVADEQEALGARDLCLRTRLHDLNSHTKQCLSNLVKWGLLKKARGRKGYLRIPAKS